MDSVSVSGGPSELQPAGGLSFETWFTYATPVSDETVQSIVACCDRDGLRFEVGCMSLAVAVEGWLRDTNDLRIELIGRRSSYRTVDLPPDATLTDLARQLDGGVPGSGEASDPGDDEDANTTLIRVLLLDSSASGSASGKGAGCLSVLANPGSGDAAVVVINGDTRSFAVLSEDIGGYSDAWVSKLSLLSAIWLDNANTRLADLNLASPCEQVVLDALGDPASVDAIDRTIVDDILSRIAEGPDEPAVHTTSGTLTRAELWRRVTVYRHELVERGVGPGAIVAVLLPASADRVAVMVAIMACGAAYVPLDMSYPEDRVALILTDAAVTLTVTDDHHAGRESLRSRKVLRTASARGHAPEGECVSLAPSCASATDLGYVIYTSGSTGLPKGVAVQHGSIFNLFRALDEVIDLPRPPTECRWLSTTNICFDISVVELFWPLARGIPLVVEDESPQVGGGTSMGFGNVIDTLAEAGATHFQATPSTVKLLLGDHRCQKALNELDVLILGGEQVHPELVDQLSGVGQLINGYGPTEATVYATMHECSGDGAAPIPIGRPLRGVGVRVVDQLGRDRPIGCTGELWIGGAGVTAGYINRPELTREKFVTDRAGRNCTWYRSGDVAHVDGDRCTVVCHGRKDGQIKLRGFRVEIGEVEALLGSLDGVNAAVVITVNDELGAAIDLRAAVTVNAPQLDGDEVRRAVSAIIPWYCVPSTITVFEELPVTLSGKVDRRAIREIIAARAATAAAKVATLPSNSSAISRVTAIWTRLLDTELVDAHQNLFDAGANSALLGQFVGALQEEFGPKVQLVDLYRHTTLAMVADLLDGQSSHWSVAPVGSIGESANGGRYHRRPGRRRLRASRIQQRESSTSSCAAAPTSEQRAASSEQRAASIMTTFTNHALSDAQHVAVTGMSCRFPGASSVAQFWGNLISGTESIEVAAVDDLGAERVVQASATLQDIERFDAAFFGYSPREVALIDPQQRLFLECCWEALEDAGLAGRAFTPEVGVFGGCGTSLYLLNNVLASFPQRSDRNFLDSMADLQLALASDRDYLTSRVSYKLGLHGPSVNVQAACASSLVAVHLACQAIINGDCEAALAGGAHVPVPQIRGYTYEPGMVLSKDGHCRAFDAAATGTVFGSGVGVVALRSLPRAVEAGDNIYAVIRGSAVSNDGSEKVGFTAPSVTGQARAIADAMAVADVNPDTVSYVEAHGTGTPVGDPIEIAALAESFGPGTPGSCAIGSVKTNVGHLGWASGVAGLIKTVMALRHRTLPASLHFKSPNPHINFNVTRFRVNDETCEWTTDRPRRAGVSAFGLGGANAHVVVEEYRPSVSAPQAVTSRPVVLPLSGLSGSAVSELASRLAVTLRQKSAPRLPDVAVTLDARRHFSERAAVVAPSAADCAIRLHALGTAGTPGAAVSSADNGTLVGNAATSPVVIGLFTGQGSEYLEMACGLWKHEPVFTGVIEEADRILRPCLNGRTLSSSILYRSDLYRGLPIEDIDVIQPANFAVQAALVELWRSWGIEPDFLIGHSLGEYAAAYAAGVFDLETGLCLVAERGRLLATLPDSGSMAALLADEDKVRELISFEDAVDIGAINGPCNVVISGNRTAVERIVNRAVDAGVKGKILPISRAGHSAQMDSIKKEFASIVASVGLRPPARGTLVSTLTGDVVGEEIATSTYWSDQLRHPVRFADALRVADKGGGNVFLEYGPNGSLSTAAQMAMPKDGRSRWWLETLRWERDDLESTRLGLAGAYVAGLDIRWTACHDADARRVSLPAYPFQRKVYWIGRDDERRTSSQRPAHRQQPGDTKPDWLYEVQWQRPPADGPNDGTGQDTFSQLRILVLGPECDAVQEIHGILSAYAHRIDVVTKSATEGHAALREALSSVLQESMPDLVIDLWPLLTRRKMLISAEPSAESSVRATSERYAGAALALLQAVSDTGLHPDIVTVTAGAFSVDATDSTSPAAATVSGIIRTARIEHPQVKQTVLDVDPLRVLYDWEAVVRELPSSVASRLVGEREIVLRGDGTFVRRLRRYQLSGPPKPLTGAYIVTGGLYGLGPVLAEVLAAGGAESLVLLGRRTPDHSVSGAVRHLEVTYGVTVMTTQLDVSSRCEVESLFDRLDRELTVPLRGIVHAAGVIDDGIIDSVHWDRLGDVLAPKAQGAWNLHAAVARRRYRLRHFVMTSSITGLFGNAGQVTHAAASAYLDGLAHHRRSLGLTALSVDLGAWSDVGFLAERPDIVDSLERSGMGTISRAEGVRLLTSLLQIDDVPPQIAIVPTAWDQLDDDHYLAIDPIIRELRGEVAAVDDTADDDSCAKFSPDSIRELCVALLSERLGRPEEELAGRDFVSLGLDSLGALSMCNALQRRFQLTVPVSTLFENSTVDALAATIWSAAIQQLVEVP